MGVFNHKRCGMLKQGAAKTKKEKKGLKKEPRTDVGTRNPYAMVEHKFGIKIDWRMTSPKAAKKFIEKNLKVPYNHIFMPEFNAAIFTVSQKKKGVKR